MGSKRIVLLHATAGAYKGMHQILGTAEELPTCEVYPSTLTGVHCFGREATVTLVAVTESYVLYRENVNE